MVLSAAAIPQPAGYVPQSRGASMCILELSLLTQKGDLKGVQALVQSQTELLSRPYFLPPSLVVACREGHFEIARFLLERGASRVQRLNETVTALCLAAANGHAPIVELLVSHGCPVENFFGTLPLHHAARAGHARIVDFLLSCPSVDIDAADQWECQSALHVAISSTQTEVLQVLLARRANPWQRDRAGRSPLQLALEVNQRARTGSGRGRGTALARSQHCVNLIVARLQAAERSCLVLKVRSLRDADLLRRRFPAVALPSYLSCRSVIPAICFNEPADARQEVVTAVLHHVVEALQPDLFLELMGLLG